jgi:two-component system sensor histidine kinase MtrB
MSRPLGRLGLRRRVLVAFALGFLLVTSLAAVTTYLVARGYLSEQRTAAAVSQTEFDARAVEAALRTERPAVDELLDRLDNSGGDGSVPVLRIDGRWYDERLGVGVGTLPDEVVEAAERGERVIERIELDGTPALWVALSLDDGHASYVEVHDVQELDSTLSALTWILLGTTTLAVVLGLLVGRWASQRTLRPLHAVAGAAGAVARGDLDTRLDVADDPDLVGIGEAFNATVERLQKRVERDERFAGNVSHELRSPLMTMVNAVDLLSARADELPAETREVAELLAEEAHRLARMVDDLLDISRTDRASFRREPVELATLVRIVADRCAGRAVTVVEPAARSLVCIGDKRRLEQVVVNLVSNAERHGGGVVAVRVERGHGCVRVAVEDHGPGVAPEDRERIFERFSRGPQRGGRDDRGVGLGLALVREHVRGHHGEVWAEPRPGGGARFVVELPAARAPLSR